MKILPLLLVASASFAQNWQPNIVDAKFENRAYSGDLNRDMQSAGPAWFGYAVKSSRSDNDSCCWNDGSHGCWLENSRREWARVKSTQAVQLEGSDAFAILFRVDHNTVEKIRAFSLSCPLDAGGLPFVWLTSVSAHASLLYLEKFTSGGSDQMADAAIFAISQHDGSEALDLLIHEANSDPSAHVRAQTLFWLAQKAGKRASEAITNAIQNDPDTEVKKKAVFALSQLPKDDGVPKLIEVAKTQRNPEVRKQAFFWLSQSQDPRAVAFIEQVLMK